MFFVIPEMPSKTFVMLYKKLPDHFKHAWNLVIDPNSDDKGHVRNVNIVRISLFLRSDIFLDLMFIFVHAKFSSEEYKKNSLICQMVENVGKIALISPSLYGTAFSCVTFLYTMEMIYLHQYLAVDNRHLDIAWYRHGFLIIWLIRILCAHVKRRVQYCLF